MKKFLGLVLALAVAAGSAFAQGGAGFDYKTRQFAATDFARWTVYSSTTVAVGAATITIDQPFMPTAEGFGQINPYFTNNVFLIQSETSASEVVTASSTSCTSPTSCTITATFANAHTGRYTVKSGSYGVNEAIKWALAQGGGRVVIPVNFGGATANITGAVGSTSVQIDDLRTGTNATYGWSGSAYVKIFDTGNTSATFGAAGGATFGVAGSVVGAVVLANATSGTVTVNPPTGALGTVTVTTPKQTGALPTAYFCGATSGSTTCANTATNGTARVFGGIATLSSNTAVISGISPAFTSTSTFTCVANDLTTRANPVQVANTSTSSITITNTTGASDVINYICVGY